LRLSGNGTKSPEIAPGLDSCDFSLLYNIHYFHYSYYMMKYATITEKGQITLPMEIRRALNLEPGKKLNISLQGEKIYITKPVGIEDVREQLQHQMNQKGTGKQTVESGGGWTSHVREKHGG
jgi:AbrB family looped-hinge helix DNA binding protein